ncbi:MAG: GNAT family N-acetyltransferase [Myxococcota bacterium]|jgi:amino-acid N-acetyltransferase|nr:GNAT family N-acetyltransferase [Myxococcota bacterium]
MSEESRPLTGLFRERDFYLAEFRGRALAIALPSECDFPPDARETIEAALADLRENGTPVILLSDDLSLIEGLAEGSSVSPDGADWLGNTWRSLQRSGCVALALPQDEGSLAKFCSRVVLEAQVSKLVWLGRRGMLWLPDGRRRSLVPLASIEEHARVAEAFSPPATDGEETAALLREFERMIQGSASSVSACLPGELDSELFTYAGSGTFYAREGYTQVRELGIDDFDAAEALIHYGMQEGYLLERSAHEIEVALANGIGAFIEGRYLAGICALMPHDEAGAGEVASLYALTRFVGEGVGVHLVQGAIERAREQGLDYVFACTTSDRVEAFFLRIGFERVSSDAVPASKWEGYDEARRKEARCLRIDPAWFLGGARLS